MFCWKYFYENDINTNYFNNLIIIRLLILKLPVAPFFFFLLFVISEYSLLFKMEILILSILNLCILNVISGQEQQSAWKLRKCWTLIEHLENTFILNIILFNYSIWSLFPCASGLTHAQNRAFLDDLAKTSSIEVGGKVSENRSLNIFD